MREVGDAGGAGPGDDGDEKDADDDGAADTVEHQDGREDAAKEDTEPHGRTLKDMRQADIWVVWIGEFRLAAAQPNQVGIISSNDAKTTSGLQSDERDEETDTCASSQSQRSRNDPSEPLPDSQERENEEQPAFQKDRSQSLPVSHTERTRSMETDDRVSEISVETHSRRQRDGQVGQKTHKEGSDA